MGKLFNRANGRLTLSSAAFLLAGSSLVGTLLGIARTSLINSNFSGFSASAYFAAFKIPDFIFFTLATGALGVAFMPVLADKLAKGGRKSAWELTSSILNLLAMVTLVFSIVSIIFARPLLQHIVAPGFTPEQLDLAVAVMRIVSINPFLFAISTVLTSAQQSIGRFFFFAIAPLFYNTMIILGIVFLGDSIGIISAAVGVAIGAMLQLIVVGFGMIGTNFRYRWGINYKDAGFKQVITTLPARSIDQGIDYINSIVETRFASGISRIAVANYENALQLHNAPIMLIGIAISTAAFPRFTQRISQGRPDLFRKEFLQVLRAMIWIALPVVIISYFAREYFARLIFKSENLEIALIFGSLAVGIFFRTMYTIISRYYYAQKDTKTPLVVSIFTIALNIFLAYRLSRPDAYGIIGLAIAQSIVAVFEVFELLIIMIIKDTKLFNMRFVSAVGQIFSASGFTVLISYLAVNVLPLSSGDRGITIFAKLSIIASASLLTHIIISSLLRLEEVAPVTQRIRKIILRPVKI
jgi:putative peptidoglycan lipid II flippase